MSKKVMSITILMIISLLALTVFSTETTVDCDERRRGEQPISKVAWLRSCSG